MEFLPTLVMEYMSVGEKLNFYETRSSLLSLATFLC